MRLTFGLEEYLADFLTEKGKKKTVHERRIAWAGDLIHVETKEIMFIDCLLCAGH